MCQGAFGGQLQAGSMTMATLSWAQASPYLLFRETGAFANVSGLWVQRWEAPIASGRAAAPQTCRHVATPDFKQTLLGSVQESARHWLSCGQQPSRRSRRFSPAQCAKGAADVKDVTVVAEPAQGNELKVRVDVSGNETQRVYSNTIFELSKSTPAGPGFRKAKGGKTALVSKEVLLHMLGPKKVKGFVIDRIVNQTLADYVEQEGLGAKKEAKTVQSADDLMAAFTPGKRFGFDATLILEEKSTEENVVEDVVEATT